MEIKEIFCEDIFSRDTVKTVSRIFKINITINRLKEHLQTNIHIDTSHFIFHIHFHY